MSTPLIAPRAPRRKRFASNAGFILLAIPGGQIADRLNRRNVLMAMLAFAIKPDSVTQSALAPYVATGTRVIALVMPGSLRAQFHLGFEKFREALIQNDKGSGK